MDYQGTSFELHDQTLGALRVRCLRYSERQRLVRDNEGDETGFMLELLALCITNADGEPVGSAEEWDTFAGERTEQALAIFTKACTANGFTPEVTEGN